MNDTFQVINIDTKTSYTPDEMMMALKNMTIEQYVISLIQDNKYTGIFKEKSVD